MCSVQGDSYANIEVHVLTLNGQNKELIDTRKERRSEQWGF